ncbi:MAG: SURF1 family protein [Pseudomonadota bacterium]|nr:SURF1 family protein [Pseudomonadota bacterium]
MSTEKHNKRPLWVDVIILILAGVAFLAMILLGNWQVKRLAWKLDLIERVEASAYGDPVDAKPDEAMPEYLRVKTVGAFQHDKALTVKALTDLGAGAWVLTPLQTEDAVFWVNRGFVPSGLSPDEWTNPVGDVEIVGLARPSVPEGTALEKNDPSANRWVSVDLEAMDTAFNVESAPYFIAMEHVGEPATWPRGGLTKLEFRNSHLSYALTWYGMALLFFAAMAFVIWDRVKSHRTSPDQT